MSTLGQPKMCVCCEREIHPTPGNFADVEFIPPVGHVCRECRRTLRPYVDGLSEAYRMLRRFMIDHTDPDNRNEAMAFLERWQAK